MKNVTEWSSTIKGILLLVVSVLVGFGVISPDESVSLNTLSVQVLEGVLGAAGGIVGIYQIFWKGPKDDVLPAE